MTNGTVSTKIILAVDDTPENLDVLKGILLPSYRVKGAINGQMALKIVENQRVDLILLDIMMPGMDGYEVCRRLKENPVSRDIPVIFLTARIHVEDERRGLEMGAVDYITKPISPPILMERVKTHLSLKEARDLLHRQNQLLEEKVRQRTLQLSILQDVTMMAMGSLAETRDPETGGHIHRTRQYVQLLAEQLADHPKFRDTLTPENITLLSKSAPLHDIGKVGVPDRILLKKGRLTPEEFEEMKKHTIFGRDAIASAEQAILSHQVMSDDFLRFAKELAYSHHERWDGGGYPEGLAGEAIPLGARLMAVADVYDALISERVYKPAYSHEESVNIIREGGGSQFDPDVVAAFLELAPLFRQINGGL